jgi:hypothetical protein
MTLGKYFQPVVRDIESIDFPSFPEGVGQDIPFPASYIDNPINFARREFFEPAQPLSPMFRLLIFPPGGIFRKISFVI